MTIEVAEWSDILTVLHESSEVWSAGLTKSKYQEYISRIMSHPWARRNYQFLVLRVDTKIVCSCKLYTVNLSSRGKQFKFAGMGAIFTMPEFRNQGYATKLITGVIDRCMEDAYDGALLFSDIDPEFYSQLGFTELGAADFGVYLPKAAEVVDYCVPETVFVGRSDIPMMLSLYRKWQRTQPFGFERSETYLDYKLTKEGYLAEHSTLAWPKLEISYAYENGKESGYALTERGGHNLRILEIVGNPSSRRQLWSKLVEHAIAHRMHKIRGWESVAFDLAPGFRMEEILSPELTGKFAFKPVTYTLRNWGKPMFMPFDESLDDWAEFFPCPILELDHL